MARIEEELYASLGSEKSIIKYVPNEIGEIVYCDSDNPKAEPDSKEQTRIKMTFSIVIPLAIIAFCWIVFNESPIFDSIATVVMVFCGWVAFRMCKSFTGTDFFVGTDGAAIVTFDKTRDNIIEKIFYYFRDFEDLLLAEVKQYQNGMYQRTDYQFIVYGHEQNNVKKIIVNKSGSYDQKKPDGYYKDQTFRFWKKIEHSWSNYKLAQLKDALNRGESIGFNLYIDDNFCDNYIVFKGKEITIGNKIYNKSNIKNILFEKGNLIIEDVNHSSKLFGLIEKGDKATIPLHTIGNRELFLTFFQYFASTL